MTRLDRNFDPEDAVGLANRRDALPLAVEIFVAKGFCALEASAITQTLILANELCNKALFRWRYVSDTPGFVSGSGEVIVRAEPAIDDYGFSPVMIVLGGSAVRPAAWLTRARQMKRKGLGVVLLSDAATAYIRATKSPSGRVTTHWHDAALLHETGYHPALTDALSEKSDGIITAAGIGATSELVLGLIAPLLSSGQLAELGNRLLLPAIRKSDAPQPQGISGNPSLFDGQITRIVTLMEETIAEPLSMTALTRQVRLSTRQVERMFRDVFGQSPARFYKQLRTKKAWTMVQETTLPLADIAAATGFKTAGTMAKAVQDSYGETPTKLRARKTPALLKFA